VRERLRQIRDAWRELRRADSAAAGLVVAGALLGALAGVGIGFLLGIWTMVAFGVLFSMLGALLVFNRRLQKAQYNAIEGQTGAAAAVLNILRGQWFVSPAVAVTAKQDMVHRVVGRCGVVLVGEGAPQRVKGLLAKERKRLERVAGDAPITVLVVGDGDGQVPIRKLQSRVSRLPRKLRRTEVPRLERRLKPLDRTPPIPKGIDPMAVVGRKRPKPR
jgi:hypothetical protein